jgi:predicted nucleic acid-binding Zn ribbon protein
MRDREERPRGIREILDGYLRRAGLKRRLVQTHAVDIWAEVVGPQAAKVTVAEGVTADGVLRVRVTTGAWLQELQLQSPEILRKLAARGTPVNRILWRLG